MFVCLDDNYTNQHTNLNGGSGENRTPTPLRALDFESVAKTKTHLYGSSRILSVNSPSSHHKASEFRGISAMCSERVIPFSDQKNTDNSIFFNSNIAVGDVRSTSMTSLSMTKLMTALPDNSSTFPFFISDFLSITNHKYFTSSFTSQGRDMKEVCVRISKMDLFTKRNKDLERVHWFSFPIDLLDHPDFFDVNGDELMAFIWFVCVAAKIKKDEVRMNLSHTAHKLRIKESVIESMLEKLEGKQLVVVSRSHDDRNATAVRPLQNRTEQYITVQDTTEQNNITGGQKKKNTELNRRIWESYLSAYSLRYKVEPTRNPKVNSQINNLGQRLGEDAIEVVSFYVRHNDSLYFKAQHTIGLCLTHAEALHTQWKRNRPVTSKDAKRFENTAAIIDTVAEAKAGGF